MTTANVGMITLSDSDLVLADEEDDVRGFAVLDADGHRVGDVADIVIDEEECRARLLVVASGGLLGIGETKRLVPVEAVANVTDEVRLDFNDENIRAGNAYDPALTEPPDFAEVYDYYGFTPFWHAGYVGPYFHNRH